MNVVHQWSIRPEGTNPTFEALYGSQFNTTYTTIQLHHSGKFTPTPNRDYVREKVTIIDYVEVRKLSKKLLCEIMLNINWMGQPKFYGFEVNFGLDLGLFSLESEDDFRRLYNKIFPYKCNQVHRIYVEVNGKDHIASFPESLKKANPYVIEKMVVDFVEDHPRATMKEAQEYVHEVFGVWITDFNMRKGFDRAKRDVDLRHWGDY